MTTPFSPPDPYGAPVDLIQHSARLIRMRWLAGLAVLAATPFSVYLLRVPLPQALYVMAGAQFAFDWLALAAFVHLTGGVESPAIWFFLFHVLLAPILLPGRATYVFAGLVIAAVAGGAGLGGGGWLPHYRVIPALPPDLYRHPLYVAGLLVFFTITVLVSVGLMVPVVRELRERERQIATLLQAFPALSRRL